jgi:hypothetical protein
MGHKTGKQRKAARFLRIVNVAVENAHSPANGKPVRMVNKDRQIHVYHAEPGNKKLLIKFDKWKDDRNGFLYMACGSLFDAGYHIINRQWMKDL